MAESIDPDTIWPVFGAFSQAVIAGTGKLVFLKGQVALDRDGKVVGAGDMGAQVERVLENIRLLLAPMNGRMSDIVSLTQFTTDIEAFMAAGEVRMRFFAAPFPVTTTVEIRRLYDPALMIEITAIAEIPLSRFRDPGGAAMHGPGVA